MSNTMGHDQMDGSPLTFWERHSDRILGLSAVIVLAVGTVVFHLLEDWSWVDSFYFSSIAASTVGFGDITPSTDASKLFTVFYVFTGITIITLWLNVRFKRHATLVKRRHHVASAHDAPATSATPLPEGAANPDESDSSV